ncbi:MAG: 4'-phosphopantetheinyl transferase superfamily protein [Balneolaceae bacterium]|nr:4'-phosphopantetheinyl transferase superfamily protein [Balneolaceae bacterium]
MNTITSRHVSDLPDSVFIAFATIREEANLDNPFLNYELISETRNKQRIYEHVSSRELLLQMLKARNIEPNAFNIDKTEDGKPFGKINDSHVYLSFSHTDELVFCALSTQVDIGIDAEKIDRPFRPELLKRIAGEEEIEALATCKPIAIWTMKEAVVKCLGIGIRRDLRDIRIQKEELGFSFLGSDEQLRIVSGVINNHQISVAWRTTV